MFCGALLHPAQRAAPRPAQPLAPAPLAFPGTRLERTYPWRQTHGTIIEFGGGILFSLLLLGYCIYMVGPTWAQKSPAGWLSLLPIFGAFAFLFLPPLAGLLNVTTLRLNNEQLVVETAPLAWPRTQSWPANAIRSLAVKEQVRRNRRFYRLEARLDHGRSVTLLSGFARLDHLQEAANELRTYLRIEGREALQWKMNNTP